jgi:hypothetical protein
VKYQDILLKRSLLKQQAMIHYSPMGKVLSRTIMAGGGPGVGLAMPVPGTAPVNLEEDEYEKA